MKNQTIALITLSATAMFGAAAAYAPPQTTDLPALAPEPDPVMQSEDNAQAARSVDEDFPEAVRTSFDDAQESSHPSTQPLVQTAKPTLVVHLERETDKMRAKRLQRRDLQDFVRSTLLARGDLQPCPIDFVLMLERSSLDMRSLRTSQVTELFDRHNELMTRYYDELAGVRRVRELNEEQEVEDPDAISEQDRLSRELRRAFIERQNQLAQTFADENRP